MESLQPQLVALPPLLDIWPLIADNYSACCLHVINDGQIVEISAIQTPLVLSQDVHHRHRRPSYPSAQLRTLISAQCLLNVLTFSVTEGTPSSSWGFKGEWEYLQQVYPQTYIIVALNDDQNSWFQVFSNLLRRSNFHHLPEIFVVHHEGSSIEKNNVTLRIKFLCWYCRVEAERDYVTIPLDTFGSSCCVRKSDCGSILTSMVTANVFDFAVNFWSPSSEHNIHLVSPNVNMDPFKRDLKQLVDLTDSVAGFLYGNNVTRLVRTVNYFPYFRKTRLDSIPRTSGQYKLNVHYVGETPAVKFVTMKGIVDIKSSYEVYFAPFTSQVWFIFLVAVCASLLVEIFLVKFATTSRALSLNSVVHQLLYWKFSSFIGQHSTSDPPLYSLAQPYEQQQASKGIFITTAAWFVASTIIINNYGAFFSAESLRSFPYTSEYENVIDLENFTLYFLVNEQKYIEWLSRMNSSSKVSMYQACTNAVSIPPECEVAFYINRVRGYYHLKVLGMKFDCVLAGGVCQSPGELSAAEKWSKSLQGLQEKSFPLANGRTAVERKVEAVVSTGTAAAFLTHKYEFQYNWAIFADIMRRYPDWKIANNFESDDKFGVQTHGYYFTAGLHERYRRRFEGRLQVLLSSGIYDLWSKWQRIRLSMSGLRYDLKSQYASNGSPGDPVSFENSATWWLFWAQCVPLGTTQIVSHG